MKSTTAPASATPLGWLLERPEPLAPDDEATVAASRLQQTHLPALPVVDRDLLIGLVSERALIGLLADGQGSPGITCRALALPAVTVSLSTSLREVTRLLQREGVEVVVAVDDEGAYCGLISRRRVVEAVEDLRRPRPVGGLATPVGVHLVSATQRGGVGDGALVLTGVVVYLLALAARWTTLLLLALVSADPAAVAAAHLSPVLERIGAVAAPGALSGAMQLVLFLTFLRLSPLAGYHSGEHQTVHAIERGLPLTYENVRRMPRAHRRCGTNLVVLLGVVAFVALAINDGWPLLMWLVPAVAVLYSWRPLGMWVQDVFTTKPASPRQIGAGIAAAEMLLARHQSESGRRAPWWRRVWNRGFLQVGAGLLLAHLFGRQVNGLVGWLLMHG